MKPTLYRNDIDTSMSYFH